MMKIKKMYKPGQLLTIRGRVYRVKRAKHYMNTCHMCDAGYECLALCDGSILCTGTPGDCYLQLVKPKSSLG